MAEGIFVMTDGLDGVGKGTSEIAILDFLKSKGLRVFDQVAWEKEHRARPRYVRLSPNDHGVIDIDSFDVAYLGEPSYVGTGWDVRFEQIASHNKGKYSARETLMGYSLNRLIHYERCVIPLLAAGKNIVQSRGLPASDCYQGLQADQEGNPLTKMDIFSHRGNRLAIEHKPNLLIIPTIKDPSALEARLQNREKQDDTFLEGLPFQLALKPYFERESLRKLFEDAGSKVTYIDAGISVEETKKQAVDAVRYLFE